MNINSMKIKLVLFLAVALFSCTKVKDIKDPDTDILREQYEYYKDNNGSLVKHGTYRAWYENEMLSKTGEYIDNKASGVWKYWNRDGQQEYEINYRNGLRYGTYKKYIQGIVAKEENYKWDTLQGKSVKFYPNGTVLSECTFVDGNFDGEYVVYDTSGAKSQIRMFKNGVKTGKWQFFNKDGSIRNELHYEHGCPVEVLGIWKLKNGNKQYYEFRKDGTLIYTYPTFGISSREKMLISYDYSFSLTDLTFTSKKTGKLAVAYSVIDLSEKEMTLYDLVKKIELILYKVK